MIIKTSLLFFFVHIKTQRRRIIFKVSGLKSVLENVRFRGGLLSMVGLTVEIKFRFKMFHA